MDMNFVNHNEMPFKRRRTNQYNPELNNYEPKEVQNSISTQLNQDHNNFLIQQQSINYLGNIVVEINNKIEKMIEVLEYNKQIGDTNTKQLENIDNKFHRLNFRIDALEKQINDIQIHLLHINNTNQNDLNCVNNDINNYTTMQQLNQEITDINSISHIYS